MKTRRHMDARPRGAQLNPAITRRGIALIAALVFTASLALANYHFVYYATSGPPYTPLFERFAVWKACVAARCRSWLWTHPRPSRWSLATRSIR